MAAAEIILRVRPDILLINEIDHDPEGKAVDLFAMLLEAGVPGVEGLDDRVALIVGHPGHELRVHAWLGLARPVVSVLTDGTELNSEPNETVSFGIWSVKAKIRVSAKMSGAVSDAPARESSTR